MKDKSYLIHSSRKGFPVAVFSVAEDTNRVSFHGWTRQHHLSNGENVEAISVLVDVPVRTLVFCNTNTGVVFSYGADISFLTDSSYDHFFEEVI